MTGLGWSAGSRSDWRRLMGLALAMVLIDLLELRLASATGHAILSIDALPFLAGVSVLPLAQEAILGALLLTLTGLTIALGADVAPAEAIQQLSTQIAAIGLCLWACHLKTRLDHSNTLLQSIFACSPVGKVVYQSGSSKIVMANPAMAQLLGVPLQQLIGRHWHSIGSVLEPCHQATRERLIGVRGLIPAEVVRTELPAVAGGQHLQLVQAIDIAERLASEQALEQQQHQLRQALQASLKGVALVHELRQPLALLLLQCQQLRLQQDQTSAGEATLREGLAQLQRAAEQIDDAMNAISGLLRSANRNQQKPVDLSALVGNLLADQRGQVERLGVALVCEGLESRLRIDGDPRQLRIAIANLLRNALEALDGQPPGQRCLHITLAEQAEQALLTIADSGPGLPSLDLESLQLRSRKRTGLGLGLFTAALVADHHGGSLSLGCSASLGGAEILLSLAHPSHRSLAGSGAARPGAPARFR